MIIANKTKLNAAALTNTNWFPDGLTFFVNTTLGNASIKRWKMMKNSKKTVHIVAPTYT